MKPRRFYEVYVGNASVGKVERLGPKLWRAFSYKTLASQEFAGGEQENGAAEAWVREQLYTGKLVAAAAEAQERFGDDELERFQREGEGDAECTACGKHYFSATGHPTLAICGSCR